MFEKQTWTLTDGYGILKKKLEPYLEVLIKYFNRKKLTSKGFLKKQRATQHWLEPMLYV